MKIFVTAIALVFAIPAAAQTAPVPQQHQDHAQHGQMQHGQMQHDPAQPAGPGQHDGHANMGDCCADRNGNGRMDCCENMAQGDRRNCCQEQAGRPAPQQPAQPQH